MKVSSILEWQFLKDRGIRELSAKALASMAKYDPEHFGGYELFYVGDGDGAKPNLLMMKAWALSISIIQR